MKRLRQWVQKARQSISGRGSKTQPGQFNAARARFVQLGAGGIFVVIAMRAVTLQLFPAASHSLDNMADNQYQREIELAPYRGTIFDRQGEPLAISIRRPSLAINPRVFKPSDDEMRRLAGLLHLPQQRLRRLANRHGYFAWLARQLDHRVAEEVESLGLEGLVQIREPARFYPAGNAAAQIVGFMGLDNQGLTGLEHQFDKDLRGQGLKILAAKDARGNFIFDETTSAAPLKTGNNIHLTIDRVIQEITEDELEVGMRKAHAKKGFAIVSDPHTGRILAIANYPGFDPNDTRHLLMSQIRNNALLDTFEPGSVTKPFLIGKAIEAGKTTPEEIFDTEHGMLRIGRDRIHDAHVSDLLTTTDIVIRSSNIGTYKIAQKLGKQRAYDALRGFGIGGNGTKLDFPGESSGRIAPWQKWATIRFANVSFGHGFVTTGLELVQAMGALANGGNLMKPTLIERIVSSDGVVVTSTPTQTLGRAISPDAARVMRHILQEVITDPHGTATLGATKHYTTAGKTGTAQKVDPGTKGYAKNKYLASFVGFAPVEDPHLVIYVQIDEPAEKPYGGGMRAAPVFSAIAERCLKYLNVAPDKPDDAVKVLADKAPHLRVATAVTPAPKISRLSELPQAPLKAAGNGREHGKDSRKF